MVELSKKMAIFLQEAGHPKAIDFNDKKILLILPYLSNIYGHLNALNASLQRENVDLTFCCEKVQAFNPRNTGYFFFVNYQSGQLTLALNVV